jgi:integrase
LHPRSTHRAFQRHLRNAGVRRITFHELRRTFGTRMAATGVPMRTLQEWMGHADIQTTSIYLHYAPSSGELALVNAAFASAHVSEDAVTADAGRPVPRPVPN